MHDNEPLTVKRVSRVLLERIWPAVHTLSFPFEVASHQLPGEAVSPAEGLKLPFERHRIGSPWGPAWGTTWFRLRGTVPQEWAGHQIEAVIDLGFDASRTGFQCEGLIYDQHGTPLKAVNPQNQHTVLLNCAEGEEEIHLYLEAAANPDILGKNGFSPTYAGDTRTASPHPMYQTRRMDLAVFDPEVHGLALDIEVLLQLCGELPEAPRKHRILHCLDAALDALDLQDISGTAPRACHVLSEVLNSPAEPSAHSISAIGHAHIDSAWLWPVRETIRKVARTATSMVDLIDRTEDFIFGMSSAQQYAWIKEHRPEVWTRLVEAVSSGRFIPLGGMWVESDVVMPSGEAIIRQFSQGQRFFDAEFGIRCQGVWLPDSFGYSPALPQLIHKAGFEWFFTQKISWNQVNTFPHHTFEWEGIDGSRIFTHFPPMDTYNAELSGEELARATRQFRENRQLSGSIAPVGYGDGGGGTTREMVGRAERLRDLEGSAKVTWEHPHDFYARAKNEYAEPPVWVGELYLELHRGTLTSQHKTKQGNRRSEHLLVEAELWATTAALRTDYEYPYQELDELWQLTLLHQFHDILPGTSIAWVHREAQAAYAEIGERTEAVIAHALRALTGEGRTPLRVNSLPYSRAGVQPLAVSQVAAVHEPAPVSLTQNGEGFLLENELVKVTVCGQGHVTSAVEKASARESIAPGEQAGVLQLHQDFPNKWDAWDVDEFYRNTVQNLTEADSVIAENSEDGSAVVSVTRSFSHSQAVQKIILEPGSRTLRWEQSTDWNEAEKFLKVSFPLDIRAEHTIAETQFGHYKRATHTNTSWEAARFEASMHRFVMVEEPGFGVALINDSIYGYDVTRHVNDAEITSDLRLSLLRAPRFPDPETDQGMQTHVYGLVIGADAAVATEQGMALNVPERVIHGEREVSPLVTHTGEGTVVSCVKLADDRSGDLIVRVYENRGRRDSCSVSVAAHVSQVREVNLIEDGTGDDGGYFPCEDGVVSLHFKPFEVRTLRFAVKGPGH